MNNFINKPNSVKHRSLSSLISRIEKSLIYGSYGNLPKSITEEIYRGLSNLIDDSIVQSFFKFCILLQRVQNLSHAYTCFIHKVFLL